MIIIAGFKSLTTRPAAEPITPITQCAVKSHGAPVGRIIRFVMRSWVGKLRR